MKQTFVAFLTLSLLLCISSSTALADKANGPKAKFFAKYDKNNNGKIDADEKEAIRKDYAANPDGDLKRFDKNKDGKLDDEEIAAVKKPEGKKKGEKSEKTKKADETKADKPAASSEKPTATDKTNNAAKP
jgi:Ca2+-binding EF-hand superfamily protein